MTFDLFADDPVVEAQREEFATIGIFDEIPAAEPVRIDHAHDELELEGARQHLAAVRAKYLGVMWPLPEQVAEIHAAEQAVEIARGSISAEPAVCDPVQVAEIVEPAPASKPRAAKVARKPRAEVDPFDWRGDYPLQPTGEANRWSYRGELVRYDAKKQAVDGRGRWSSIEGIGKPELRGMTHDEVCKAIDARMGEEVNQ
jgi:hypothetical protein